MSRRGDDLQAALRLGLSAEDARLFADRCEVFDRNTIRLSVAAVEADLDSYPAMLARVDMVIAELDAQLAGEVTPWPA